MSSLLVPIHQNHLRGLPEFPYGNVQIYKKVGRLGQWILDTTYLKSTLNILPDYPHHITIKLSILLSIHQQTPSFKNIFQSDGGQEAEADKSLVNRASSRITQAT